MKIHRYNVVGCIVLSAVAVSASFPDVSALRDVLFPCVSLLVVVVLVLAVVCVCRYRRRRAAAAATADVKSRTAAPPSGDGNGVATTAASSSEFPVEFAASSVRLVCDVCDDGRLGAGRVYLGELAAEPPRPVVVRTLPVDADERSRSEFWRDVDAVHRLRHPHVAAVVGVTGRSVQSGAAAAASVLLECGADLLTLHQYVILAGAALDHAARLRIAVQIAAGMDYLSSRGIVHGDLAARSVMMVSTGGGGPAVAKLSVGLSLGPALFAADYQTVRPDRPPLPIRWMAPEAIASGGRSPTTAADVWSFGVTLWELYSAGCRPYDGFDDAELVALILGRRVLPCPPPPARAARATSWVYGLMVDCWARRPDDRPTFGAVLARLEQWEAASASVDDDEEVAVTAAGRRRGSSSRSNSTPSGRPSPYSAVAARTCRGSSVLAPPPPDASQRPPAGPVPPQSELTEEGDSRWPGASCTSQYGRRPADDHCTSAASVSSDRRHSDRQPPPTDAAPLDTVDVL